MSANAIGMPSAMAPSSDRMNTAMVMLLQLFGFAHRDEILFAQPPGEHAHEIVDQDHAGRDAEHDTGAIEERHGEIGGGRAGARGDERLLPASREAQPA